MDLNQGGTVTGRERMTGVGDGGHLTGSKWRTFDVAYW